MPEFLIYLIIPLGLILNVAFLVFLIVFKNKAIKIFCSIIFSILTIYNVGMTQGFFIPNYAYINNEGFPIASYARSPKIETKIYLNEIEMIIDTGEFYYKKISFKLKICDKNDIIINELDFTLENLDRNQKYKKIYTMNSHEMLEANHCYIGFTKVKGHQ